MRVHWVLLAPGKDVAGKMGAHVGWPLHKGFSKEPKAFQVCRKCPENHTKDADLETPTYGLESLGHPSCLGPGICPCLRTEVQLREAYEFSQLKDPRVKVT